MEFTLKQNKYEYNTLAGKLIIEHWRNSEFVEIKFSDNRKREIDVFNTHNYPIQFNRKFYDFENLTDKEFEDFENKFNDCIKEMFSAKNIIEIKKYNGLPIFNENDIAFDQTYKTIPVEKWEQDWKRLWQNHNNLK